MSDVREINQIEQLGDLREAWNVLLDQTPRASFFQSLEWLETYWRHFGLDQKLRTLVVSDDGRTVGIVPLAVRRERTRLGMLRVLTYPLHDWGSFYGPIGPDPAAALASGLQYVRATRRDWDLIELRWVSPDGGMAPVEQALETAGYRAYRSVWDQTALVDLGDTRDGWFNARPAKWRSNVRRDERRLRERGTVEYIRYRPLGNRFGEDDPRWDLYGDCETVARRSWQGDSTNGTTLTHTSIRAYLRDAHAAAAARGEVDMNLLYFDGRPLAFSYNYYRRGRVQGLRSGFDAELAREGAGNLLHVSAIRDSFARGDLLYDLGVKYLECKRYLMTRIVPIYRYSHFALSPRAQLLRVKRWMQAR